MQAGIRNLNIIIFCMENINLYQTNCHVSCESFSRRVMKCFRVADVDRIEIAKTHRVNAGHEVRADEEDDRVCMSCYNRTGSHIEVSRLPQGIFVYQVSVHHYADFICGGRRRR